ncbi:hypothetical protein [Streptomyces laurentii]|uniref:hypothetical protein n=1 Tax=Streptomyces laurentii TaxID=39478 RepID=UPI00368CF968
MQPLLNAATVTCPAGSVVTGGGIDLPGSTGSLTNDVYESYPRSQTTWQVTFNNKASISGSYSVYAVCLPVTPAP